MKNLQRILGVSLSALLLAASLAGCTDTGSSATPTPDPSADPSATPTTQGGTADLPLVDTPDVIEQLLGFSRDTALFTVDGQGVAAEDFLYGLSYATENVGYNLYGSMEAMEWDGEVEGTPIKTYLMDSALESAQFYHLVAVKAAEYGVTVSAEDQADLDTQLAEVIAELGGEEAYGLRLQEVGLSDAAFRRLNQVNSLYQGIQEHLFGDAEPTEEELTEFAESTADALRAKHILILTQDDEGNALSEEEQAAARTRAEDLLAQLRASDDPITLFDTLMNENSEDGRDESGLLYSAEGYLFTAGQMVEEFEAATRALAYNEISDLVQTTYGYHIILRLRPVNDEVLSAWIAQQMNDTVDQWMADAVVETTAEFAAVDPQTYYEKLSALREELEASVSDDAEATATPEA